jgi:hypothetical protein
MFAPKSVIGMLVATVALAMAVAGARGTGDKQATGRKEPSDSSFERLKKLRP